MILSSEHQLLRDTLADFAAPNHAAELALARLSGVSGLVPSVDWLLYGAIRKEALLTSQIEGTQATLTDLFGGSQFPPVVPTGSGDGAVMLTFGARDFFWLGVTRG